MKFSVDQADLSSGLSLVGRAISQRHALPILGNALLSADGSDKLALTATDLELMIRCSVSAEVESSGSITLPYSTLSQFVSALPKGRVHVEIDESRASAFLSSSPFDATINGIPAEEYPEGIEFPADVAMSLDSSLFRDMVSEVSYAASDDEARPVLQGVLVRIQDSRLTMVAADGYRLAVKNQNVDQSKEDIDLVIPARAMKEMSGFSQKGSGPVEVAIGDGKAFFRQDVVMASSLLEYSFPDYGQIIPEGHTTELVANVGELVKALRLASVFSSDHVNQLVVLETNVPFGRIEVSAVSAERGRQRGEVGVSALTGESLRFGFNGKYLLEALSAIRSDSVRMLFTTPTSPVVMLPTNGDDVTHVLMTHYLNE
jgi:DNA polymerase-3 subunit beta